MSLIRDSVREILDTLGVRYAVIGAVAVAARGAPRSTFDLDLLTTDGRVLQASVWQPLRDHGIPVVIRRGDADDPLAGVIQIGEGLDRIDLVVGKSKWEQAIVDRAETVEIDGAPMRLPSASDLILLKLAAGGPIDQADIHSLLEIGPRGALIEAVNAAIGSLPADARALWQKIASSGTADGSSNGHGR